MPTPIYRDTRLMAIGRLLSEYMRRGTEAPEGLTLAEYAARMYDESHDVVVTDSDYISDECVVSDLDAEEVKHLLSPCTLDCEPREGDF